MEGREKIEVRRIPIIVIEYYYYYFYYHHHRYHYFYGEDSRGATRFWWEDLGVDVKVMFTLELATKTQRGSRGIALLFP